jgi:hypothetical protein
MLIHSVLDCLKWKYDSKTLSKSRSAIAQSLNQNCREAVKKISKENKEEIEKEKTPSQRNQE